MYGLLDFPILLILVCGLCWLCVCLWFLVLVGSFFGGPFQTSWLSEGKSVPHLLFSVVQVWAGCVGAGSSMCTRFLGFSLALVTVVCS